MWNKGNTSRIWHITTEIQPAPRAAKGRRGQSEQIFPGLKGLGEAFLSNEFRFKN